MSECFCSFWMLRHDMMARFRFPSSLISDWTKWLHTSLLSVVCFSLWLTNSCLLLPLGTLGDVIFVADIGSQKISYSELTRDILTPLPISNVQNPTRVAFDPFEDRIYWTEPSLGMIARSKFNGEMYEVIRNNGSPTAIGLDLVGRNVFWINSDEGTIEVSNLNGDNWKVLISDPKPSPQDIVLDTTRG